KGETLVAVQLKPALEAPPARPRDLAIIIDTSASQAGSAYTMARSIIKALDGALSPTDRISILVARPPTATKCLTSGSFQAPKSEKVADALNKLENVEYCAGATDLKNVLRKAVASFDLKASRQPAIVLLGDGDSAYNPVTNPERYQIAQEMVGQKIAFFAI